MIEAEGWDTDALLWQALRRIAAATQAFLLPDNPARGQDFASATIEAVTCPYVVTALNKQPDGFTAVTIRTIAEAVEGYLTRRLSLEELIGATISAVDTPQMAIVLCKY